MRRATIADVAREAGVAVSTASVVFSGKAPVREATRERVLAAAVSLGYTGPDPRAASLRRGRSGIVGVVFEENLGATFLDPVKARMMDGIADGVAPIGAGLLLLRDDGGPDVAGLTTAPIDAAILVGCSGRLRESLSAVRSRGIPVVVIEGDAGPDVPVIGLDNREAQAEVARHLRSVGHEDVVILTLPFTADRGRGWRAPDDDITVHVTRDRLRGARDVYPDARIYASGGSFIDEGLRCGRDILAAEPRPTAVLAQSDLLAAGMLRAAEEAGLRVPQDISITGFDGIPIDGLSPRVLTTAVQPAVEKGQRAGAAVAAMLTTSSPQSTELVCMFRIGDTSGPVPDRAFSGP